MQGKLASALLHIGRLSAKNCCATLVSITFSS